ncbi:ankyrin repeat domain-containing protein [Paenibacillus eucommiae]|uniref:Ankyrin repeat protein n=1 Tax=Paenibacillus eucommiae TaxID=1355755 RepID=A0ABS4IQP0_9BACL|nr:ankyrin repeat domain-containing protein [Paenibacillus eucommiae]MBP1989886.1 ankyrin repeat protein [Paenibacillus eucommiae]
MMASKDLVDDFLIAAVNENEEQAIMILDTNKEIPYSNIYAAAILGEIETVQDMLSRDAALAVTPGGPEFWEPLHYLSFSCFLKKPQSRERFLQTAKILLEHGANPNAFHLQKDDPYERKLSSLYGAVGIAGNAAVGKVLLDAGANPNDGESLYHSAELTSHDCLDLLYQYGVDIHASPALFRKLDFDDYAGVKWFVEHGADLEQSLGDHGTPLHWAVFRGRSSSIIELLLKHGAQVNAKRPDGKTAYTLAVRYGQTELADILLQYGANTDVHKIDSFFGAYAAANEPEILDMMKNEPALLTSLSHHDLFMLLQFAEMNNSGAVSLMLKTGFDSHTKKEEGTALHIAAWFGHLETVKVLIASGASLTMKNAYGGTPLGSAIHGSLHHRSQRNESHASVVEALLQAGSPIPEKASGSKEVIEILCRYGAFK